MEKKHFNFKKTDQSVNLYILINKIMMWPFKISHISFNKIKLQKCDIFTKFWFSVVCFF